MLTSDLTFISRSSPEGLRDQKLYEGVLYNNWHFIFVEKEEIVKSSLLIRRRHHLVRLWLEERGYDYVP